MKLSGAFIIEMERKEDERGFFTTSWSEREFSARGLNARMIECNISFNARKNTLRGMHYQFAPRAQAKLVRCTRGAVYDVIVDLRPESPTFRKWAAVELAAESPRMLYIPEGFAHGFQTLRDETEILYQMSDYYVPELSAGIGWDDPAIGIEWPPAALRLMSAKDRALYNRSAEDSGLR